MPGILQCRRPCLVRLERARQQSLIFEWPSSRDGSILHDATGGEAEPTFRNRTRTSPPIPQLGSAPRVSDLVSALALLERGVVQLADMDNGAAADVGDGLAQNFVGQGRRVPFAEKEEAEHVGDRVAFLPLEVDVWDAPGHVFDMDEDGPRRSSRPWGCCHRGCSGG